MTEKKMKLYKTALEIIEYKKNLINKAIEPEGLKYMDEQDITYIETIERPEDLIKWVSCILKSDKLEDMFILCRYFCYCCFSHSNICKNCYYGIKYGYCHNSKSNYRTILNFLEDKNYNLEEQFINFIIKKREELQ